MRVWAITDAGKVRQINEDSYMFSSDSQKLYCAVCDGMGGVNGGEVASRTAIDAFAAAIDSGSRPVFTQRTMEDVMRKAVEQANRQVYERGSGDPELNGMGTTIVCMLCCGNQAVIGNVGDSRAYIIDENGIRQITLDHSLVSEMIRRGELSHSEALSHPNRNVITRVLGVEPDVECDTFRLTLKEGQYVLLCSDGLTNEVSEPEIYYEIFFSHKPENACQSLLDIASQRGGRDNITMILASF